MESFKLIAKTFQGLEEVLAGELNSLGAANVTPGRRMVSFTGNQEMMYRANFALRTAVRILKPIATFTARTADEVYDAVKGLPWDEHLDPDTSFAVDSVVYSEEFRHSKFVAYKVKDAIVDYFRERTGKRPNISVTNPDIRLNMHIAETECTLSLDSSGESLHKRGYRMASVDSPINEVLAAGLILMTGWKGECDLIDPMCGSGTIAIEAALIARNIAPGVFHKHYAFENWKDFDRELFDTIYNDDSQERPFEHHIYAYDIDKNAVAIAQQNVKSAGVSDEVTVEAQPIQQFKQPDEKAIMITNPPYGERITTPNLLGLYRTLGEKLKHQFVGNDAWIIGYREETFDQIGLRPSVKIPLFNGSLDCQFCKYQIFNGKLENFRAKGNILKTDEERERNAAKRKLKPRYDFKTANDNEDEQSDIPEYMQMRHREFIIRQQREERRRLNEERQQENEGREHRERRPKFSGDAHRKPYGRDNRHEGRGNGFGKGRKSQEFKQKGNNNRRFNRHDDED